MPYTPSGNWSVDYFQINGADDSVGESAIVLLVDTAPTDGSVKRVISAVLIDVGMGSYMIENLVATMKDIKKEYSGMSKYGLQFDAIIITHWDRDHYAAMCSDSDTSYFKQDSLGPVRSFDDPDFGLVKSFKYSADRKTPLTRFYCEYWNGANGLNAKTKFPLNGGQPTGHDDKDDREDPFDIHLDMFDSDKTYITNFFSKASAAKKKKLTDAGYDVNTYQWQVPCMVGYCLPSSMIGTNVFTGDQITGKYTDVANLVDLLKKNRPGKKWAKAPGLYIIAVQIEFPGDEFFPDPPDLKPNSKNVKNVFVDEDGKEHPMLGVTDPITTWRAARKGEANPYSVCSLLVWDTSNTQTPKPKISLYTGGDAEWVTEAGIVNWLSQPSPGYTATCIKAGHHGSKAGTSVQLIQQLKPEHVIFSAGYLHGHPVHELLLYLEAWWRSKKAGEKLWGPRLHSVCYPYWLLKVHPKADPDVDPIPRENEKPTYFRSENVNTNSYEEQTAQKDNSGVLKYQNDLDAAYKDWKSKPNPTPLKTFKDKVAAWNGDPMRDATTTKVAEAKVEYDKNRKELLAAMNDVTQAQNKKVKGKSLVKLQTAEKTAAAAFLKAAGKYWQLDFDQGWQSFQLVASYFDQLWTRWSGIPYDFCPIQGQGNTAKRMRYLKAQFKIDSFEIAYVDSKGNKKTLPPPAQKNPPKKAVAVQAVEAVEAVQAVQAVGEKRKREDESTHDTVSGYILKPELEAVILACENNDPEDDSGSELGEDDQSDNMVQTVATVSMPLSVEVGLSTSIQAICPSGTVLTPGQVPTSDGNALLDNFICCLPDGMITLAQSADIDPSTGTWNGELDANDSLHMWWSSALPKSLTSQYVLISGLVQNSAIVNFQLSWGFESPDISGSRTTLEYSSGSLSGSFGADQSVLDQRVNSQGQFLLNTGFLLGLVGNMNSAFARFTLRSIFDIVDMSIPPWLGLVGDVATILDEPSFKFSPGGGNGIWFYPLEQLFTQIRFEVSEVVLDQSVPLLNAMLNSLKFLDLNFGACTIVAIRRQTVLQDDLDKSELLEYCSVAGELTFESTISIKGDGNAGALQSQLGFKSYLTLTSTSIQIVMRLDYSTLQGDPIDTIFQWLGRIMSNSPSIDKSLLDNLPTDTANGKGKSDQRFMLREIYLNIEQGTDSFQITSAHVTFEVAMRFGLVLPENKVPFGLTFSYSAASGESLWSATGSLWQEVPDAVQQLAKMNTNNPAAPLLTPIASPAQYYISIPALVTQISGKDSHQMSTMPSDIPTYVTTAEIEVSNLLMSLRGTMSSVIPGTTDKTTPNLAAILPPFDADTSEFPTISLTRVEAGITYTYGPPAIYDVFFRAVIILQPKFTLPQLNPAILDATVRFDKTGGAVTWSVDAQGMDFNAAVLYSLFPSADNEAVMNVLAEISIQQFNISFAYNSVRSSKRFVASGTLMLGPAELDLDFRYDSTTSLPSTWSFEAKLRHNNGVLTATLGDVLGGISAELLHILPDFITSFDLQITPQDFIDLECSKKVLLDNSVLVVFSIIAKIGSFEFSFFQISDSTGSSSTRRRMLRITLDKLPSISGYPLVDKMEQPFDSMDFIWNDNDLLRSDIVNAINPIYVQNKVPPIVFKDPRSTSSSDQTTLDLDPGEGGSSGQPKNDSVIAAGCHFIIVYEQNNIPTAILDYNFAGRPTKIPDSNVPQAPVTLVMQTVGKEYETAVATGPGASAAFARKIGPLSINAIKLNYEQGLQASDTSYCSITFDAKLMLGPVSGILYGFGLRFPMTSIQKFNPLDIRPTISGIGLELYRPPIAIAGMLNKIPDGFEGALSLEIEPYTFLGGGSYSHPPNKSGSIFAFAEVDGPLLELEFATLSGLIAGFGYNDHLTLPTVDNVTTFPFLTPPTQSDPLTIEQNFLSVDTNWFQPWTGKDWLTAGLTAKAFHVLTVSAAIVLDLDVDVILGVFADCTATVPADAASDADRFAVADLGIVALLDYGRGIFQVEGQLTPKSFIFSKDCKLTGGFALCYWFKGSGHEGDWVFSVGGYHSAFQVPDWYPKPKRLAVSWQAGDVTISGDAYFAVTPKACMGGGHLHIAYQSGHLSAWFDAFADFLINYGPFYFLATIGVNIGIKYVLKAGPVEKNFDIDFSATLNLHGPPLAGSVTIDWSIISFTIYFGSSTAQNKPLTWDGFQQLLLQPNPSKKSVETMRTASSMQAITATNGLLDDPNSNQMQIKTSTVTPKSVPPPWTINGAVFAFSFVALFPISSIQYNSRDTTDENLKHLFDGTDNIYVKPMHVANPVESQCKIEIKNMTAQGTPYQDFAIQSAIKRVPTALWGQYTSTSDPSSGVSPASLLNSASGATSSLVMGFNFSVLSPQENGPFVTFPLLEIMYDCMQGVTSPHDLHVQVVDTPAMGLAYEQWLPDMDGNHGSSLTYPTEYSADYWTTVTDVWHNPSQSVSDIVQRWCNVCGANEGVKYSSLLAEFASTSAPPTHLIDNLADINYMPPLYTPTQPTYSVEILAANFGSLDVSAKVRSGIKIDTGNHSFQYTPDWNILGDPNPFHTKEFSITWRTGVAYPQYYDSTQAAGVSVSMSQPKTSAILEGHTVSVDYSKHLSFGDPEFDNNGRHVYSAVYHDADVTAQMRALSRKTPFLNVLVNRSLYLNTVPPNSDGPWALVISYCIVGLNGSENHTVIAGDHGQISIPPGVTPMPRLTIHRAMWSMQDMTDEILALVTYRQTLTFNTDPSQYPSTWINSWPLLGGSTKSWSIMYQYGDEPLELLVAMNDGGVDSGVQVIDYNQRPQPQRNLFFNPGTPSRISGGNNILAIVWGHNRTTPNGAVQKVGSGVYDEIGSGAFMCTNENIGFDGEWGVGKSCHVYYQYGLNSPIQCATGAEVPTPGATPIQHISVYDSAHAPMPGNGLLVQNILIGGCQIMSVATGKYLVYSASPDGIPVMRAEGTDSTKALVFKADTIVDRKTPPLVQAWDPVTQSTYQLQLDRNNDIFLLPGGPVPQPKAIFGYELHLDGSGPSLLLSSLLNSTINEEPFVLSHTMNDTQIHSRALGSTLNSQYAADHANLSWRVTWLPADPATGPSIPPPVKSRITSIQLTPAIQNWLNIMNSFFIVLPYCMGVAGFQSDPSIASGFVPKWWSSLTPWQRADISQSVAAVLSMPQPDNFAATDLFPSRCRILWRELYEAGHLWDLLTWRMMPNPTKVDPMHLFSDVSTMILKLGGEQAFNNPNSFSSHWVGDAFNWWKAGVSNGAIPPGFDSVSSDLLKLMQTAKSTVTAMKLQLGAGLYTDDALFAMTRSALAGWADVLARVDP